VQDAGGAPPLMAAHSRHVLPCDEPAVELLASEAHCGTSPEPLEPLFLRRLAQELRRKRRRVLVRPPLLRLPQRPLGETLLRERLQGAAAQDLVRASLGDVKSRLQA
jgi:hypothetical protein